MGQWDCTVHSLDMDMFWTLFYGHSLNFGSEKAKRWSGIDEILHNRKLFTISILWTFLQSRNSVALFYLSTMSWEKCTLISVLVALLVPGKAFALLDFLAWFLTLLPCVCLLYFVPVRCIRKPSVHVDYTVFLTVIFCFSCFVNEQLMSMIQSIKYQFHYCWHVMFLVTVRDPRTDIGKLVSWHVLVGTCLWA